MQTQQIIHKNTNCSTQHEFTPRRTQSCSQIEVINLVQKHGYRTVKFQGASKAAVFLLQNMPKEDFTAEATILCFSVSGIEPIFTDFVKSRQLKIKPRVDTLYFDKVRCYFAIGSHRCPVHYSKQINHDKTNQLFSLVTSHNIRCVQLRGGPGWLRLPQMRGRPPHWPPRNSSVAKFKISHRMIRGSPQLSFRFLFWPVATPSGTSRKRPLSHLARTPCLSYIIYPLSYFFDPLPPFSIERLHHTLWTVPNIKQ